MFTHSFDVEAAEKRLRARWNDPTLAPAIYTQTGAPLQQEGEEAVSANSAECVDRIVHVARIGEGTSNLIALLSDGRFAAYVDQANEFIDVEVIRSVSRFQEQMAGNSEWLSSDGNPACCLEPKSGSGFLLYGRGSDS